MGLPHTVTRMRLEYMPKPNADDPPGYSHLPKPNADDPPGYSHLSDDSTRVLPVTSLGVLPLGQINRLRANAKDERNKPRVFSISEPTIDIVVNKLRCEIAVELPSVSAADIHLEWASAYNRLTVFAYVHRRPLNVDDEQVVCERICRELKRTIDVEIVLLGTAMEEAIVDGKRIAAQIRLHGGIMYIHLHNLSHEATTEAQRRHEIPDLPLTTVCWTIK
ncbi:hypothetical protein CHU98_g8023 [Xylaria longipes]|nr:hypothetical protein CHU98_g8023 [Xylaria longipes]